MASSSPLDCPIPGATLTGASVSCNMLTWVVERQQHIARHGNCAILTVSRHIDTSTTTLLRAERQNVDGRKPILTTGASTGSGSRPQCFVCMETLVSDVASPTNRHYSLTTYKMMDISIECAQVQEGSTIAHGKRGKKRRTNISLSGSKSYARIATG